MTQRSDEVKDFWKKPDHLSTNNKSPKKPKKEKGGLTIKEFAIRLLIHGAIILLLGGVVAVGAHYGLQSVTRHGVRRTVPDLQALTIDAAERLAERYDLMLVVNDSLYAPAYERGTVLDQLPAEGTVVKPGRAIYVTINATQQKMVDVPYVAGRSLRQAKNMLDVAGLTIERLNYQPDLATNYILSQSYDGKMVRANSNLRAPIGSGIVLNVGVSEDNNETPMPLVVGQSLYAAKSALWGAGLNVESVEMEYGIDQSNIDLSIVMWQSIPPDSTLRLGYPISLEVTMSKDRASKALKNLEIERSFEAQMLELEQALNDSLELIYYPYREEEEKPVVEKVDFEDLFN
ncbi:MAG: PASTA domain-containing protein [Rikenellaceae bacterium]